MLPLYAQDPHWKEFFPDSKERQFLEDTIEEQWIDSTGTQIHLDIYEQDKTAPTVIYCHGLSSCARMMAHLVSPLYKKGYNVICPDLLGFGMTVAKEGSGTIDEYVKNLIDSVNYARQRYTGPVYLTGISMGGGLSYYAAAAGAEVNTIACLCLMDFAHVRTHELAVLHILLKPIFAIASRIIPHAYVPMGKFLDMDNLCPDPDIVRLFRNNPLATKHYTVRSMYSIATSHPAIPFEEFDRVPVLVLHAKEDLLLPERISIESYQRLGGAKAYIGLENCGHIPLEDETIANYVSVLDDWFRQHA